MPLVDITLRPGYEIHVSGMCPHFTLDRERTRQLIKDDFAQALPSLLVEHAEDLGLDLDTPPEGVQVMRHDYDEGDVNVANVWVKIRLSEEHPPGHERRRIRDLLYELLIGWFREQELDPENFVMDLFWGPTNGRGTVDGTEIVW